MEVDPLSIILVKSDSKGGDRLLFRYPCHDDHPIDHHESSNRKNPYSVTVNEDLLQNTSPSCHLNDQMLSNLFAVKPKLCGLKFELKVNDIRFVGHAIQFPSGTLRNGNISQQQDTPTTLLINIIFALHAYASHSIVKCYFDLSKRLGIALRHEEKRCCYVTNESRKMISVHDDIVQKHEQGIYESPHESILDRCDLAKELQQVYTDLCNTGLVYIRINKWIEVSFCLPHKVHQMPYLKKGFLIEPETIEKCCQAIRPFHGLLLLVEPNQLIESLPSDSSPALIRLIKVYSPVKSLQTLAIDADISLGHVLQLTSHLLYWAKAIVIYPLCLSNIYAIAPDACTVVQSPLVTNFSHKFSGRNLLQELHKFSLPTTVSQLLSPLLPIEYHQQLFQMIAWLLQHRLLLQLHTYVYLMPNPNPNILHPTVSNDRKSAFEGLTSGEIAAIYNVPAASYQEDVALLSRLHRKGYLTGKSHLEEIMYFENIQRSQLLVLLDKFREVLVFCEMEDPAISMFYPHSNEKS